MRTTIELTDQQRAGLLKLAAERGEKGFSRLVQEAVDRYLAEQAMQRERVEGARDVLGSLSEDEAAELEQTAAEIRESWR